MDDYRNLRQTPVAGNSPAPENVDLGGLKELKPQGDVLTIDLADGGVTIDFQPVSKIDRGSAKDHEENLAFHMSGGELGAVANDLLRWIKDDISRQDERMRDIVTGIDLLGIKLEEPHSEPGDEGISVVNHPLLLEAILRFQAGCRGELLPADGPVKVANEGDGTIQQDMDANTLERDMNHYLTVGAPEYYPDTDRMFFSLGHGGEAYKKVYYHPIKRRPVSETIDRKDIILSEGAVSLEAAQRVTHRSKMKPSDVKRMMISGAWRNIVLSSSAVNLNNPIEIVLDNISGIQPKTTIDGNELDREIYECYCELELPGFEHPEGLPLPYRVTLDRDSREILDIRRWWKEGDEDYVRKEVFVEYVFVPAFPGVNLGLLHILGNASRALTAAWRIALDNGMLANFPGGIMARSAGKQQTTSIRVGPGQVAPMDTDNVSLKEAFMPLPYRDVTSGFVQIIQNVQETAQRLGGTAETNVGEGRGDAPVGTTIALIDQAQKVLSAVHKRMHTAQQKEFGLLRDLFAETPEALWRSNKNPGWQGDAQRLQNALTNYDIVPKADPNTASQTLRIQKAIAIYQLAQANPAAFDQQAVYMRLFGMLGVEDATTLFNKNPQPPQPPQADQASMMIGQAKIMEAQTKAAELQMKAQDAQQNKQTKGIEVATKMALAKAKIQDTQTKAKEAVIDQANHAADREAKLRIEELKLAQSKIDHLTDLGNIGNL